MKKILIGIMLSITMLFTGCFGPSNEDIINTTKTLKRFNEAVGNVEDELFYITYSAYIIKLYDYGSIMISDDIYQNYVNQYGMYGITKARAVQYGLATPFIENYGKMSRDDIRDLHRLYAGQFSDPNMTPLKLSEIRENKKFEYSIKKYKLTDRDKMDSWFSSDCKFYTVTVKNPDILAKLLVKIDEEGLLMISFEHSTVTLTSLEYGGTTVTMASEEYFDFLSTGIMFNVALALDLNLYRHVKHEMEALDILDSVDTNMIDPYDVYYIAPEYRD